MGYLAFGFEGINDENVRANVMKSYLGFLTGTCGKSYRELFGCLVDLMNKKESREQYENKQLTLDELRNSIFNNFDAVNRDNFIRQSEFFDILQEISDEIGQIIEKSR